jgi:hypothetical protein
MKNNELFRNPISSLGSQMDLLNHDLAITIGKGSKDKNVT